MKYLARSCVCVCVHARVHAPTCVRTHASMLNLVQLFVTPWTVAHRSPLINVTTSSKLVVLCVLWEPWLPVPTAQNLLWGHPPLPACLYSLISGHSGAPWSSSQLLVLTELLSFGLRYVSSLLLFPHHLFFLMSDKVLLWLQNLAVKYLLWDFFPFSSCWCSIMLVLLLEHSDLCLIPVLGKS